MSERLAHTAAGPLTVEWEDDSLSRKLAKFHIYDAKWTYWMEHAIAPGMVCLDVGANLGYFSVLLGRLVGPTGRVLAIEPEARNLALLRKNVAQNAVDAQVEVVPCAAGDQPGEATFWVDERQYGIHSLVRGNLRGTPTAVTVPVDTLDRVVAARGLTGRVAFAKIDVQGAEPLVLDGAADLLAQPTLSILMEIWPRGIEACGSSSAAVFARMRAAGFTESVLDPCVEVIDAIKDDHPLSHVNVLFQKGTLA